MLLQFEYDANIMLEQGDRHASYFCNRSTMLLNWWLDDIGLGNFHDHLLHQPTGTEHLSMKPDQTVAGKDIKPHELQDCSQAELQQTRILEVRMPNTEADDWELMCVEMQVPEGKRNSTRGTMVHLSQSNPQPLYPCKTKKKPKTDKTDKADKPDEPAAPDIQLPEHSKGERSLHHAQLLEVKNLEQVRVALEAGLWLTCLWLTLG